MTEASPEKEGGDPRTDTFDRPLGLGIGGCAKGMLEVLLRQLLREGVRDEVRRDIEE
jgi:hypothetical protein